jgi:hypothetical protein
MLTDVRISRRSFLIGVAGFGVIPVLHDRHSMFCDPPTRLAFVGMGSAGNAFVAQTLHANAEVVACCDVRPDVFRQTLDTLSASNVHPVFVTDYRELLCLKGVDAIVVATPVDSRASIVRDAIAARKHVFVRSPYSLDLAEATNIFEDSVKKKRLLMHASSVWGWDLDSIVTTLRHLRIGPAVEVNAFHGAKSAYGKSATDTLLDTASVVARLIPGATPETLTTLPFVGQMGQRLEMSYSTPHGRARTAITSRRLRADLSAEHELRLGIRSFARSWTVQVESLAVDDSRHFSPDAIHSFLNQIHDNNSTEWRAKNSEALDLCRIAIAIQASTIDRRTVSVA